MTAQAKATACDYLAGVILVLAVWFMMWTWPVWLWCAGSFVGAWLIHRLRLRLRDRISAASSWTGELLQSVTKDGRDALLAVAFGCFVVTVAQFVLRLCNAIVNDEAVRRGEFYLGNVQHGLAYVLSLQVPAVLLGALVLLAVIFPRLRLTRWTVERKKLVSKVLIAVTASSSFTFFGSATLANSERHWTASRRAEFAKALARIGVARRELIAGEAVKRTVNASPAVFRTDLRTFLIKTSARADAAVIAEGAGERLGRQAPALSESNQQNERSNREAILDGIIDDVRIWTEGRTSSKYRPSLSDLQLLGKTADRLDAAVSESHAAVAELVKTAAGGVLPAQADTFVRLFAKSLVGAVARHSMASVYPRTVSDLRTAALWLDLAAGEPKAETRDFSTRPEWRISLRTAETFLLAPEAAVAVEIQVAKNEGEERRKREADEREARRLEVKRANEEYRAREVNRRAANRIEENPIARRLVAFVRGRGAA